MEATPEHPALFSLYSFNNTGGILLFSSTTRYPGTRMSARCNPGFISPENRFPLSHYP
jgi:hypothetical protein